MVWLICPRADQSFLADSWRPRHFSVFPPLEIVVTLTFDLCLQTIDTRIPARTHSQKWDLNEGILPFELKCQRILGTSKFPFMHPRFFHLHLLPIFSRGRHAKVPELTQHIQYLLDDASLKKKVGQIFFTGTGGPKQFKVKRWVGLVHCDAHVALCLLYV